VKQLSLVALGKCRAVNSWRIMLALGYWHHACFRLASNDFAKVDRKL